MLRTFWAKYFDRTFWTIFFFGTTFCIWDWVLGSWPGLGGLGWGDWGLGAALAWRAKVLGSLAAGGLLGAGGLVWVGGWVALKLN